MAFDVQPHLTSATLELRPLTADDFDVLYAVARDPLIWEQHPDRERWREERFREWFKLAMEQRALVAVDRTSGQVIGSSRFLEFKGDEVEIGYSFLARARWGGAWNGEMKRLMLEHAFASVRCVVFVIGPENERSRRAVEKLGGVLRGSKETPLGARLVYELTPALYRRPSQPPAATVSP